MTITQLNQFYFHKVKETMLIYFETHEVRLYFTAYLQPLLQ